MGQTAGRINKWRSGGDFANGADRGDAPKTPVSAFDPSSIVSTRAQSRILTRPHPSSACLHMTTTTWWIGNTRREYAHLRSRRSLNAHTHIHTHTKRFCRSALALLCSSWPRLHTADYTWTNARVLKIAVREPSELHQRWITSTNAKRRANCSNRVLPLSRPAHPPSPNEAHCRRLSHCGDPMPTPSGSLSWQQVARAYQRCSRCRSCQQVP